jgi:hypothetical protein
MDHDIWSVQIYEAITKLNHILSASQPVWKTWMPILLVLIGAILSYLPRWLGTNRKVKSIKESLIAEIKRCEKMAQGYLKDNVASPSYRLPLHAWSKSFPELLGMGALKEAEVDKLYDFYIEVDSLNRGLDQANESIGDHSALERERNRNLLKATNIIKTFEKALETAESVPPWLWWVV